MRFVARSRPGPYAVLAGVVLLWAVLVTIRHSWAGDMRLHLGTIYGLERDFGAPKDPLVGAAEGSPYYSPYMVVLAWISRQTGAAPVTVLEWAGVFNIGFWLWALRRFCRHLSPRPLVAVLAAVFTLLLWGLHPRDWSGFLSLYSVSWTLGYPSMFAAGLMLLTWDVYLRLRDGRPVAAFWLALLLPLIVLIHPFTALNTVIGLIAFTSRRLLRTWQVYAAGAAGFGLALLWPWSDITGLFGAAGGLSEIHRELILDFGRDWGFWHYGLALAGLPALVTGRNRPFGRELIALFALAVSVIGIGAAFGSFGFARVVPVAMLPLHLALASYFGSRDVAWRKILYGVVAVAVCGVGIYGTRGGFLRAWQGEVSPETLESWEVRNPDTVYETIAEAIRPGSVVLTQVSWPGRLIVGRGAYTVVPAWPYPFVDEAARRADSDRFFSETATPAERTEIADRYRVNCVLVQWDSPVWKKKALEGFTEVVRTPKGGVKLLCR